MQALPTNVGGMMVVYANESKVDDMLGDYNGDLVISAYNASKNCTVSGRLSGLKIFEEKLRLEKIVFHRINVNQAYHSPLIEPIVEGFVSSISSYKFLKPEIKLISNLTGTYINNMMTIDAEYWGKHLLQPVQFQKSIQSVMNSGRSILIELGPSSVLSNMINRQVSGNTVTVGSVLHRGKNEVASLYEAISKLFVNGVKIDWLSFRNENSVKTKKKYHDKVDENNSNHCVSKKVSAGEARKEKHSAEELSKQIKLFLAMILKCKQSDVSDDAPFLEMGADSLLLVELVAEVKRKYDVQLEMRQLFDEIINVDDLVKYLYGKLCNGNNNVHEDSLAEKDKSIAKKEIALSSEVMADICNIMRLKQVEIDVPLLELGADSLVLMSVMDDVNRKYGVDLKIKDFFEDVVTIKDLINRVLSMQNTG